jgi:RNA polymerase I-specific transcription initiation factor RRN3
LVTSWKINDLIAAPLNPLRYVSTSVLHKFAKIAYMNKIAYCYSIIDANNRISLPYSGQINNSQNKFCFTGKESTSISNETQSNFVMKTNSNPLDSFFPFDPYLLNRSKIFIQKYYQEFQDEENDDDDDDTENDDDNSENDDDDDNGDDDEDADDDGGNNDESEDDVEVNHS